jgi:quinol monooxygenase YgiN
MRLEGAPMIARHIEVEINPSKYREFKSLFDREILSILRRQPGFMGTIEMVHETKGHSILTITIWKSKMDAENYNLKEFPQVMDILRPVLAGTPRVEYYTVEFTDMTLEQKIAA